MVIHLEGFNPIQQDGKKQAMHHYFQPVIIINIKTVHFTTAEQGVIEHSMIYQSRL